MLRKKTIYTLHGSINTPAFLPDATYGSINSISFDDAISSGINEIVTTTLHLELTLGSSYVQELGGLHKFFAWDKPILTDSGGYQVFSLIHRKSNNFNSITEEGANFINHKNGSKYLLTPENSQEIQFKLDSDIRVLLDEPLDLKAEYDKNLASVIRTTNWAKRGKKAFLDINKLDSIEFNLTHPFKSTPKRPLLGAVVQGGNSFELRKRSAEELIELDFDSYNFGGLPLKEDGKVDLELSEYLVSLLPENKIRYAMGIGTPDDIVNLAHLGWDMFDCVLPTRNARHGYLFVPLGEGDQDYKYYSVIHLRSERYKYSNQEIASITHPALKNISRAYLRHLIRINETSGQRLATLHNLYFYEQIMRQLRDGQI